MRNSLLILYLWHSNSVWVSQLLHLLGPSLLLTAMEGRGEWSDSLDPLHPRVTREAAPGWWLWTSPALEAGAIRGTEQAKDMSHPLSFYLSNKIHYFFFRKELNLIFLSP